MRLLRPSITLLAAATLVAAAGLPLTTASAEPAGTEVDSTVEQQIPEARPVETAGEVTELAAQEVLPDELSETLVLDDVVDASAVAPQATGTQTPDELTVAAAAATPEGEVAVAGVTWPTSDVTDQISVYLRQRTGEDWSEWEAMEVSSLEADHNSVDGTEPMAVIGADEVQVALVSPDGVEAPQPELTVVDPGVSPADDEAELDASSRSIPVGGTARALAAAPHIYSRADWGANESMMKWRPVAGKHTGTVIHHTAGSNNYTAGQVPGLLRGIYHYHAVTRGWGDIGYNVLVDKFGRAWEGRAGGLTRSIQGAHASGYNGATLGLSVMGNYDQVAVPQVAFDTLARVAAWRFDALGVSAKGRMTVNGRNHPTVIGHKDVAQTACPGRYFYPRLGELANLIAGYQGQNSPPTTPKPPATPKPAGPPVATVINHDLTGDKVADLAYRNGSRVSLWSTKDVPSVTAWKATQRGHGWGAGRTIAPGDFNGNGIDDLMLIDTKGRLFLYPGVGGGRFGSRTQIGHGWQSIDLIATGGDWDGDGKVDLVGRQKGNGKLFLYRGSGTGSFAGSRQIGRGWQGMRELVLLENFHQGRPAVITVDSSGRLLAYRGNGKGGFTDSPVRYGTGWGSMTDIASAGQWDGKGGDDLAALDTAGNLWVYPSNGATGIGARAKVTGGMSGTSFIAPVTDRDGKSVYTVTRTGALNQYVWTTTAGSRTISTAVPIAAADKRIIVPGDFDGDKVADLIIHKADGRLLLHRGLGGGKFDASGRQIGNGWNVFDDVIGVGDFFRDGKPVLLGYDESTGTATAYPGNGRGGFGSARTIGRGYTGYDVLAADAWNKASGTPSLLVRGASSKSLFHFPGGTGTSLGLRAQVGSGWGSMNSVIAAGDINGDGNPDVVAISGTQVLLYPTNGSLRFLKPVTLGTLPAGASGVR